MFRHWSMVLLQHANVEWVSLPRRSSLSGVCCHVATTLCCRQSHVRVNFCHSFLNHTHPSFVIPAAAATTTFEFFVTSVATTQLYSSSCLSCHNHVVVSAGLIRTCISDRFRYISPHPIHACCNPHVLFMFLFSLSFSSSLFLYVSVYIWSLFLSILLFWVCVAQPRHSKAHVSRTRALVLDFLPFLYSLETKEEMWEGRFNI